MGLGMMKGPAPGSYAGWQSTPAPAALDRLPDLSDRAVSILGRYYSQLRLIPFIPDVYSVAYTQSELVRAQGLRVFDQMLLDDQVSYSVTGAIAQVLTAARVEPADVTDHDDHEMAAAIADCYTDQFRAMDGGLLAQLEDVKFGGVVYGHSVSALPLTIIQEGRFRGCVATKDVVWMLPHFLEPIHDKGTGKVLGWAQVDRQSSTSELFEQGDVLHYVIGRTKDRARGRSSFLAAHEHWATKHIVIGLRNHNCEWSVGRLFFEHLKGPNENGISKTEYDAFAIEWINKYIDVWGIPLPYGVKATLVNSNTVTPDVFSAVLLHADQGIHRAISQTAWLLDEEPEHGTRAQAETVASSGQNKHDLRREHFENICQKALIDRTARLNGWPRRLWPRFTMAPAVRADKTGVVPIYLQVAQQVPNFVEPQDKGWLREALGAPQVKEQAMLAPPTQAPHMAGTPESDTRQIFAEVGRYARINFRPPEGVRKAAARGLDLRRKHGRGGTEVGVARARDLSGGKRISPDTARRMASYFARHEVDKQGEGWGRDSAGYIAWLLWGGDAGQAWAAKLVRQMDAADGAERNAERFAEDVEWWKRQLTAQEERVDFAAVERGLGRIMDQHQDALNAEWGRMVRDLESRVVALVESPGVGAGRKIEQALGMKLDAEHFVGLLTECGMQSYSVGTAQATRELHAAALRGGLKAEAAKFAERFSEARPDRFDAGIAPDDPFGLGAYQDLLKSKSFQIARGMESKVLQSIAKKLQALATSGASIEEQHQALDRLFRDLEAGHLISPGRSDGYDYRSEAIQRTTVRTVANDAFNSARQDLYQRNSDFVRGYQISEVAEGRDLGRDGMRSHPLSAHLDGLAVPLDSDWAKEFAGAQHYNDRKIDVPVTTMDDDVEMSTEAELAAAYRWKEKLSPDFV